MKQDSKRRQLEAHPSSRSTAPSAQGRARLRASGKIVVGCAADRPARLAGDRQASAEGRRRARHHRRRHGPLFSCPLWPAPQGHGADDQSGRRHLSCRWIGPLPWAHLPLPRVSCTRGLPGTPLRPTATSERRSPDRDVEPRTYQRSTHRSVAARRQALCHPARYRGATGGVGER